MLYFAFVRIAFCVGAMLLVFAMILGHFNSGMRSLRNPYFRALGKISFEACLISPMIIVLMYCGQDYTMYLTVFRGIAFGMGNILAIVLASLATYLFLEYPMKRMS
jgi:peptidoglycan/LPS O-acetylase OafA/YrhL